MNHLCSDDHPLLPECLKQLTHTCRGVHSASIMSLQPVLSVFIFESGDMEGQVRIRTLLLARNCVVWRCSMGSGMVVLEYSAVQCLMPELTKRQKYAFLFLNSLNSVPGLEC